MWMRCLVVLMPKRRLRTEKLCTLFCLLYVFLLSKDYLCEGISQFIKHNRQNYSVTVTSHSLQLCFAVSKYSECSITITSFVSCSNGYPVSDVKSIANTTQRCHLADKLNGTSHTKCYTIKIVNRNILLCGVNVVLE